MIPKRINVAISGLIAGAMVLQLTAIPVILREQSALMAIIILALFPLNTPFWSLIHEAIHKNFHPHQPTNEMVGRLMSIIFGASFHILRFGHLMHHQYNRSWESEFYDPGEKTWKAWFRHYYKILAGLYLTETFMSFVVALTPLPMMRKISKRAFQDERQYQAADRMLQKKENLRKIRTDTLLILFFYAGCFYLYGENWYLLVLIIAGRAFMISLMDNAYHYGTPLDNSVPAKELAMPPLLAKFILNFNYHLTHHKNTKLPWTQLADQHKTQNHPYTEEFVPAIMAQFKGPLRKTS